VDAPGLDAVVHQPNRLQILGYLHRNRECSFARLRDAVGLTPGNLATHLTRLEQAGYVTSRHALASRFEVRYAITPQGSAALRGYVEQITRLLRDHGLIAAESPAETTATGLPP
jgi:DNA-binding MarR family transcriptional regulator